MPVIQSMYRLVLEEAGNQYSSSPAELEKILAAFNEQIASGAFRPGNHRRLVVLSEEAWQSRRDRLPVSTEHVAA